MSTVEEKKSIFAKVWDWVNTDDSWFVFLNRQAKWALGFFIRLSAVCISSIISIWFILMIAKAFNIKATLRAIVSKSGYDVEKGETTVVSSPQIDYDKDLNSIDAILNMLKERRKQTSNVQKSNTTNK